MLFELFVSKESCSASSTNTHGPFNGMLMYNSKIGLGFSDNKTLPSNCISLKKSLKGHFSKKIHTANFFSWKQKEKEFTKYANRHGQSGLCIARVEHLSLATRGFYKGLVIYDPAVEGWSYCNWNDKNVEPPFQS